MGDQSTKTLLDIISNMIAGIALLIAIISYLSSRRVRKELKSDEVLIASRIVHPELKERDHSKCVIGCTVFNKSKRKAYINKVIAYDSKNNKMKIDWSNKIDPCGNIEEPRELIGIVDSEDLYVRERLGKEISYCRLEIFHSFSSSPLTATYDFSDDDFFEDMEEA